MALELLGILFLRTSNCFLIGEFSFSIGSLGIISLVLFLKLHGVEGIEFVSSAMFWSIRFWCELNRMAPTELNRLQLS